MKPSIGKLLFASIVTAALSSPALAQSLSDEIESATRINNANKLLRQGKVDEAIEDYREVQPVDANRDQLKHNMAVAQYRSGDIEAAKALFTEAAASNESSLAASSRYNLGNCFYSDAVKTADQDQLAAIKSLHQAISHYRGSLAGNPNNVNARANIELAGQLLRKLQQEQQKQQENEQQHQQGHQQDHQQDHQPSREQGSQSQGSEASPDRPQQDSQSQDSRVKDQSDQQQDQSAESKPDQAKQAQSKVPQSETKSSQAEGSDSDEPASKDPSKQESAEQYPKPSSQSGQQTSTDSQSQPHDGQSNAADPQQSTELSGDEVDQTNEPAVPAGELTAAGQQQVVGKPSGRAAFAGPSAPDELMTKTEALKMLQAVRDRDLLRRLQKEQVERSRHTPVDRDW